MGRFLDKLDEIDRTFALDQESEWWKLDRRNRRISWALCGVFLVVLLGCAAWTEHQDGRIADRLRRDGVEVEARVVDNRSGKDLGGSFEEVRVVFDTIDGRHVETWAVTGSGRPLGSTRVRYLTTDPSVARLVCCLAPRGSSSFVLVLTYLFFAGIGMVLFRAFRSFDRMLGLRS